MLAKTLISRAILLNCRKNAATNLKQVKRNAGHGAWAYRVPPHPPSKKEVYLAEGFGALCWYWIIYHCITEPEHIFGEFPYIDPITYTDEELGIPPDSDGPLQK